MEMVSLMKMLEGFHAQAKENKLDDLRKVMPTKILANLNKRVVNNDQPESFI